MGRGLGGSGVEDRGTNGEDRRRRQWRVGREVGGIRERRQHGRENGREGKEGKKGRKKIGKGNCPFQLEILATPMGHTSIHFCIARGVPPGSILFLILFTFNTTQL
jgi:hypothetical protein